MKETKQAIPWKKLIVLEITVGVFLLLITFFVAARADIDKAEDKLVASVEYIKEQCNKSQVRDEASEAKSLLRVTESTDDVSRRLQYRNIASDAMANQGMLQKLTRDAYLDGLIVLDEAGNVVASCDSEGRPPSTVLDKMDMRFVLDINGFREKKYAIRINESDGRHTDVSAVARVDAPGMVIGYFCTAADYADIINNQVQMLVSGYILEDAGVIAISNNDNIIATNKKDLLGRNVDDVHVISELRANKVYKKLIIVNEPGTLLGYRFGVMDKSQEYYIYGFMSEEDVFPSMVYIMLCVLSLYIIMIFAINILLKQTEKTYQKKQLAAQQKYMNVLELKNEALREAVVQAEKASAAKSSFLSRMSHDIRTPLNGIIGLLRIDEEHLLDKNLVLENHKKMTVAADHLLSLLNDVLQMSKLEDGMVELSRELINLDDLSKDIATIIKGRAVEAGISWEYATKDYRLPHPYVYGSPVHLRQVFLNIYSNCIKYNRAGGKITTAIEFLGEKDGKCTYRWTISDTGEGMSEEFLQKIFEPFAQEKNDARSTYRGVGLGMAIVKSLSEQMGGSIDVKSKLGQGSTFVVTIPFEIAEAPKSAASEPKPKKQKPKGIAEMHLLVAEDNDLNADIITMILEDQGATLKLVADGSKAVEEFQAAPAGTYDAILMDVMMPVMDGLTATREIRALERPDSKTIPIIAMTANAFAEDRHNCLEAGMNSYLTKPLDVNKLIEVLSRLR